MKQLKVFFILTFVFTTLLTAQTNFCPGYVIKNPGDTLYGEIDYRGDKLMGEICRFRPSKKGVISTFNPGEIFGFRFIDSKYYVSKTVGDKNVFLEYLINGKVKIYYLRDSKSDHYFLEKEGENLIELPYEKGVIYKNDNPYLSESKKHVGILTYYMKDAPDLLPLIQNIKEPGHNNLIKLAEKYHNEVCDGEKCIIYEKKIPPLKVNFEITGGVTHVNQSAIDNVVPDYLPIGGVLAHIWLPRTSENMYLKTGVVFSNTKTLFSKTTLYKIPIQLEYMYPKGYIRPRVSVGFDFLLVEPACSVGVNIKIMKHLFLSLNYDVGFYNDNGFNLPDRIFSHSLYSGLYFAF